MAKRKQPIACGIVDKIFRTAANFVSYIDTGTSLSFVDVSEDGASMSYTNDVNLYGVSLEFESHRLQKAKESINALLKRLKGEDDGRLLINFVKNDKEFFVHIFSLNKRTVEAVANSFKVPIMSGKEVIRAISHYFMFDSYHLEHNVLSNLFDNFAAGSVENEQFHRLTDMLTKKVLKRCDVYQAVAYKDRNFSVLELMDVQGWKGVLSIMLDFSEASTAYRFDEVNERANRIDTKLKKLLGKIEEEGSVDSISQDYGLMNAILISNDPKYVSSIESCTGFSFVENYLTGVSAYRRTLLNERDLLFDMLIEPEKAKEFMQSYKKKIEYIEQRPDKSWILPDFYGKDSNNMFMNYSLGKNKNPHSAFFAKTGSGKSSALLKIIRSSAWIDENFKSIAIEQDLVKMRYIDIDYSAGRFIKKLRDNYPDKIKVYGADAKDMKFCLLDIEQEDENNIYSAPLDFEIKSVCSFVNTVLEATDAKSKLDNSEEDRFREAIRSVFASEHLRIDKTISELIKIDGFERLGEELLAKYDKHTHISELNAEYNFLKKPTLINVIDYVDRMSASPNISETQRGIYQTLLKKLNGLKMFNFAGHANTDISLDMNTFYVDLGEIKENQKEFVSLGWMLLRKWFKIDRDVYNELMAQGKSRQKIFYVIEESHNFFSIPSFAKLFNDAVKELRKFGIHFIFVSHSIKNMEDDVFKSIATKMFLFTEGDASEVEKEIKMKTTLADERLGVFNQAKLDDYSLFIMHDKGESTCKLEMTQQDFETFVPQRITASV